MLNQVNNYTFFYIYIKQSIFDFGHKNFLGFSKKSPQKFV